MATKPPEKKADTSKREPIPSRILQTVLLAAAVMLFIGAVAPGRWAALIVGGLFLLSAIPPLRKWGDRWLVGQAEGSPAQQATLYRAAAGIILVLLGVVGA